MISWRPAKMWTWPTRTRDSWVRRRPPVPQGLERGEMPIGAVVVVENEVVAAAHTQERTQRPASCPCRPARTGRGGPGPRSKTC